MSSVNTDNTYTGYYTKHLSDLEDELKTDYKRAEQRSNERVDDLAQKYQESNRKNGEKTDEAIGKIRDNMQENYDRSRESDRAELERLKAQNYDRFGRDRSNEADGYKEKLADATRGIESERATHEKLLRDSESVADAKNQALAKSYQERMDKAIETERQSSQKAFEDLTQTHKSAVEIQREDAEKKYAVLSQNRLDDQTDNRRRTETLISDSQRDMDNLSKHLNSAIDQRIEKDHQAGIERQEADAQRLKDSHDNQSAGLRDQVRTLLANQGQDGKDRAQGRTEAVRDYEDEWRAKVSMVDDSYQKQIAKLHTMADESDKIAAQSGDERIRDKDAYYTGLIGKQNVENRDEHNAIIKRYDAALSETENRSKREKDVADKRLESAMGSANEERDSALKNQAETYQKSAVLQKQLDNDQVEALQKQLEKKANPTNDQDISPAVENAVRRSIVQQYAKNLAAEQERNQRLSDSMQRSYADKFQNAGDEHQAVLTARNQQFQTELHEKDAVFVEHVQDTENQKEEALRSAQQDHDRQTETLNRVNSQSQVKQRNDYDSIIQNIKDDASTRIQSVRQESEFALKQQQRAFSVRENEVIRDYEKKLADLKVDYESRLDDIRNQTQQSIRDIERRDKQTYDDQTRANEQRVAQMEDQHKERERYITQNFEDQLDKVKRSNAILQSKKG